MSYPEPLSQWRATVSTAFPCLSQPQATVLALWSGWNGVGQILRHHVGLRNAGPALGVFGGEPGATFTGMVRGRQGQTGGQTARVGGQHVLCALVALALELVAQRRTPAGVGLRCAHLEEAFHGLMDQRGLSWLRDPGRVENRGSRRKGELAANLAELALVRAGKCASQLDRGGAHGSGLVRPLALRAPRGVWMAFFHAHQPARQRSPGG